MLWQLLYADSALQYRLGMSDIIGLISESADNDFKCKYRHGPDMKNDADMSCLTHMCSGCASD